MEKDKQPKFQVTNHFNCPIGQYIANIEHQVVNFDKDMQPVFASEMQKTTREFAQSTQPEQQTTSDSGENLQKVFPYFTAQATQNDIEVLKKECMHRYAATRVIDLLVEWEGIISITKGHKIEKVYEDLVTFSSQYDIPFVKQDSFESAYYKRYDKDRNKYCRIFK